MTHDEWEAELRLRFMAVRDATTAAERWVQLGVDGTTLDTLEQVMREVDLEDVAVAWRDLLDWMRRPRII